MLFGLVISIVLVMITAFSVISTLAKNVKESTPSGDAVIPITEDIAIPLPRKGTK